MKIISLLILCVLLAGCAHIHEEITVIDDICAPNSRYVDCYNSCRQYSKSREDMDLCPRRCQKKVCEENDWWWK